MPVVADELWKNPGNPGMIVVTSHAAVEADGRLYMNYGLGSEAVRRIPDIEIQCGQQVQNHLVNGYYGFLPVRPSRPDQKIIGFGLFQTRYHWSDPPAPELIHYSMECLRRYTEENAQMKIRMNFPGIGEGGLPVDEVSPLLIPLPVTVTICHQGEVQKSVPTSFPGFKSLYLQVERMLQEGRFHQAVEHLMNNGFDIQSAMEQTRAVERLMRERAESEAQRSLRKRSSVYTG
jgi:hypothetical protein